MPLVNPTNSAPPAEAPSAPRITAPAYKGVTVDTRYVPTSNILAYMEGSSWTVNYYSQVLAGDSALMGQNVNLDPAFQQYRLIKGMVLKVTSPLSSSQEAEGGGMVVTGSAVVFPFLIPNVGDMFLADTGDGREGVFQVTHSERRTILKDTAHTIEYQLIAFSAPERINDLASKTIQTLQYVADFLNHGQNPLLYEADYAAAVELVEAYRSIAKRYFKSFTSNEYKTLLVPGQQRSVYDHFLTKAVTSFFTTFDAPELRQVRKMNLDDDATMRATTIWDALAERDASLLKYACRTTGLISAFSFERNPMLEGIYHSGLEYVVYPKDAEVNIDYARTPISKPLSIFTLDNAASPLAGDELPDPGTLPYGAAPLINPAQVDDYYVFSQAFYENADTGQSKLEKAVRDYLVGNALDNKLLLALCRSYHTWAALERFYYVPVLLMLIKASIRSL